MLRYMMRHTQADVLTMVILTMATYHGHTYYGCTYCGIQASASMATALKGVNASASGLVVAAALILGQSYATSLPEQAALLTTAIQTMATLTTAIPTMAILWLS